LIPILTTSAVFEGPKKVTHPAPTPATVTVDSAILSLTRFTVLVSAGASIYFSP
jgi:hypothetical protein